MIKNSLSVRCLWVGSCQSFKDVQNFVDGFSIDRGVVEAPDQTMSRWVVNSYQPSA